MSENSLAKIDFDGLPIRVVGTQENPEWVAADVCRVLGISDPSKTLQRFRPTEKGTNTIRTPQGGSQEMLTVTEPGLYRLIFKSRKPEAERFRTWVTHEVLPSLRKHGCYPPPDVEVSDMALVSVSPTELAVQMGRVIHEACFSATKLATEPLQKEIGDIRSEVGEIRVELNRISQRKRIPDKVRAIHLYVIKNYYSGRCPCCHKNRIVSDAGDKKSTCEFDHWFRVSETQVSKTWAVCQECNANLRNADWKSERRVKFEAYQQTRQDFETAIRGPLLPGMD